MATVKTISKERRTSPFYNCGSGPCQRVPGSQLFLKSVLSNTEHYCMRCLTSACRPGSSQFSVTSCFFFFLPWTGAMTELIKALISHQIWLRLPVHLTPNLYVLVARCHLGNVNPSHVYHCRKFVCVKMQSIYKHLIVCIKTAVIFFLTESVSLLKASGFKPSLCQFTIVFYFITMEWLDLHGGKWLSKVL